MGSSGQPIEFDQRQHFPSLDGGWYLGWVGVEGFDHLMVAHEGCGDDGDEVHALSLCKRIHFESVPGGAVFSPRQRADFLLLDAPDWRWTCADCRTLYNREVDILCSLELSGMSTPPGLFGAGSVGPFIAREHALAEVYIAEAGRHGHKIGYSANAEKRVGGMQTGSVHELQIIHTIKTSKPQACEQWLHEMFADKNIRGEWFSLTAGDLAIILRIGRWEPAS